MKDQIGIVYSSVDGQTKKICRELVGLLHANHFRARMYPIEHFKNCANFNTLVIGAAVRYGKHNPTVNKFICENKLALSKVNTAFFSVNLVARNEDKNSPETNPYLIKFLEDVDWTPDIAEVFAGKLDYRIYSFFDKILIKIIMKITKGPTKTDEPIEYTNWERVRQFGEAIIHLHRFGKNTA